MSRVAVRPDMIRWARERSGLAVDALVKKFSDYLEWETGQILPTFSQLESFGKKTGTPLGYFFLQTPPEEQLPIPDFRTVQDAGIKRPSPNLLETVYSMQRRQQWMREFLLDQEGERLEFVGSASFQDQPETVAALIRRTLALQQDWAHHEKTWTDALRVLREVIEASGILVVFNGVVGNNAYRKLNPEEFRGFVLCDPYAPLIFVNNADAKSAQMFTLVHELAHLWLGKEGVFSLEAMEPAEDIAEKWCNQVAAEFLVPALELQSCWIQAQEDYEPFQYLARRFKVSPLVAARRTLDLGLIEKAEFLSFYHAYQEDERRKKPSDGGGDFYANQGLRVGKRFANAVVWATKEGRLLYTEAYRLTGLHGKTFDRYAESLSLTLK